jgi:transcriptional regulator with XRE-family HTH domain
MTIQNRLRDEMEKSGKQQKRLADETGILRSDISRAAAGQLVLPIDDLRKLCCAVGCSVTDVYGADVLRALYGIGRKRRKETERDTATVRISKSTLEAVDEYRESLHVTRKQMVEMAVDYWGAN